MQHLVAAACTSNQLNYNGLSFDRCSYRRSVVYGTAYHNTSHAYVWSFGRLFVVKACPRYALYCIHAKPAQCHARCVSSILASVLDCHRLYLISLSRVCFCFNVQLPFLSFSFISCCHFHSHIPTSVSCPHFHSHYPLHLMCSEFSPMISALG